MRQLEFMEGGRRWHADLGRGHDLAITLGGDGPQPRFFVDDAARTGALRIAGFTGSVADGGSCNCAVHEFAPHCHGTHTECVGHVTRQSNLLPTLTPAPLALALVVTIDPERLRSVPDTRGRVCADGDRVISRAGLASAAEPMAHMPWTALVIRTLPNDEHKQGRHYTGPCPAPYFTLDAIHWLVARGVVSLVVDLPSLDRGDDGGELAAHRCYWGLAPGSTDAATAGRGTALVTELAYVPDEVRDGLYLLDLQVAAFATDAAPSRPVLYPVTEVRL